jgi:superoxide dismutase
VARTPRAAHHPHPQGSGWGWLGYNKGSKALEIATCANQDPLAAKVCCA